MTPQDYWRETIEYALEEAGFEGSMTTEQLNAVADAVRISHENYGMFDGSDAIRAPAIPRECQNQIDSLKREIARLEGEILCYRKSVAERRRVDVSDVHLDQYGTVIYGRTLR
jgi:hypothetical protein